MLQKQIEQCDYSLNKLGLNFDTGRDDVFKQFLMGGHHNKKPVAIEFYQAENTVSTNSPDNQESDDESVLHAAIRLPELLESSDYPEAGMNYAKAKAEAEDRVREFEGFSKSQEENFRPESVRRSSIFRFHFSSIRKITDGAIPALRKSFPSDSWIDNSADVHILKEAFKAI